MNKKIQVSKSIASDCEVYNNLTCLARQLCRVEYSVVGVLEEGDIIVKSSQGEDIGKSDEEILVLLEKAIKNKSLTEISYESDKNLKNTSTGFFAGLPIKDGSGDLLGVVAVFDGKANGLSVEQKIGLEIIGNQVLGILALDKSKRDYLTLVESSHDMIYEFDGDANFTFANKAAISKTGYPLDELHDMKCWDLVERSKRQKIKDFYLSKIKEGEKSIYHEFPMVTKSGKQIWLGQSVDFTWVKNRVVKAIAISKDITELMDTRMRLKETEEQILAEKTLLKTMVFSAPAAIAMFSKDLKYLAFSEKWMENKYLHEQILGLGDEPIPIERGELLCSLKKKVLGGEVIGSESDLIVDEGRDKRWLKWVATPWNNTTDGSIGGIIMYADDVTHIVRHEQELKKTREEALALSKVKEEFLSNMSHEIRTPLNAIIGTTNLMMDENPSLEEDEKFRLLKFSSGNLLSLINNVLDFNKIESGNIHMEENDFDLNELTSNLVNSWKPIANKKGVDLQLKWDSEVNKIVKGDQVRLSQILNNLLNNALKFTEEGFVHLNISSVNKTRNLIQFEVKDTGVGIPSHMHEKVFQSFQQVSSEQTLEQGGTGLGLPICERLLRLMDSKLELQSSEGFGSKFFFTIKMEQGVVESSSQSSDDIDGVQLDMKVLLVEDNAANQFIAASFLDKWGVSFKVAVNGKEALEYVEKDSSWDVILMDVKMPIMDGPTAAAKIREMKSIYSQEVPIVALTASAITDIKKEGTAHLFDDYLAKPFNPKDLFKLLSKFGSQEKSQLNNQSIVEDELHETPTVKNDLRSQLESYTEGDPDFLIEFAENIMENIKQLETELTAINRSRDINSLGELIHMMKPTIEILGEFDLVDRLYELKDSWKVRKYSEKIVSEILKRSSEITEELAGIIKGEPVEQE